MLSKCSIPVGLLLPSTCKIDRCIKAKHASIKGKIKWIEYILIKVISVILGPPHIPCKIYLPQTGITVAKLVITIQAQ